MSDTRKETVTLWRLADEGAKLLPVSEFRRINWCKTHDAESADGHICWRSNWAELMKAYGVCELVELWQEQPK